MSKKSMSDAFSEGFFKGLHRWSPEGGGRSNGKELMEGSCSKVHKNHLRDHPFYIRGYDLEMSSSSALLFWLVLERALLSFWLKFSPEIIWILSSWKKSTHTTELKYKLNSASFKWAPTSMSLLCSSSSTPPTPPGGKEDDMNLFMLKSKTSCEIRLLPCYLYWLLLLMVASQHERRLKVFNSHGSMTQGIWCKHYYFCILQISFAKILPHAFLPFLFFLVPRNKHET